MGKILLCTNHVPHSTSIDNIFIKEYMPEANGSYVKVYLFLAMYLQAGETSFSISSLADRMENTENDILRALHYWEKKGLILLQRSQDTEQITGVTLASLDSDTGCSAAGHHAAGCANTEDAAVPAAQPDTENICTTDRAAKADTKDVCTPDGTAKPDIKVTEEQTQRLSQNQRFTWICRIVEQYLSRPLKSTEVQLLIYLYDTLHFSEDLILHLYEYCCSLEKTNVNYVQAVALSWAKKNITTPEEAQQQVTVYSTAHTAIARSLALGRPLAKIECDYADRWQNDWQMDLAVILEACNRTMLSLGKGDFKYLNGILTRWHRENVHTLQDIQSCDEKHQREKNEQAKPVPAASKPAAKNLPPKKTQFHSFTQRNVSEDEMKQLEQALLLQ